MGTLYDFLNANQSLTEELCSCGMTMDMDEKNGLPARLFSADTILKTHKADLDKLSNRTLRIIRSNHQVTDKNLHLLALLPCGLRNAFKEAFIQAFPEYTDDDNNEIMIEGNLNYEKNFYKYIDSLTSTDELPDIFISSDFNSLYHKYFMDNFLDEAHFDKCMAMLHPMYTRAAYPHPGGVIGMITANLLVMMVDENKFEPGRLPRTWKDLLDPLFGKRLVLRGDSDFFCNAVFYPFYKQFGEKAITQLAANTLTGMHPSEMVKAINTGHTGEAAVFVMPYSFAVKTRGSENFRLVWPEDGAIVSPVQMLVKKGAYEKYKEEIDFITGSTMGEALEQLGFPSANIQTGKSYPGEQLNWLGWDFIAENDMNMLRKRIQQVFFQIYKTDKTVAQ
jgi:ABC-type Fe3+ transport system substrate-binding protein